MKTIITTFGLPGTGKTKTALWLRSICDGGVYISRNHIRGRLKGHKTGIRDFAYAEAESIDRMFFSAAKRHLLNHDTVILDATFRTLYSREQLINLAHALNCQIMMVECVCSYPNIVHNLRREARLKLKSFVEPIKLVIEFYVDTMQHFSHEELKLINHVRFDTERRKITSVNFLNRFVSPVASLD